jgi:hypothetical protein
VVKLVLLASILVLLPSCGESSVASDGATPDPLIDVVYTRIYVSDHPSGLCPIPGEDQDPGSHTRHFFSFLPRPDDGREVVEADYTESRVATDPCTYRAEVKVLLEPGVAYEVCVESRYRGSWEIVTSTFCGIIATLDALADGRLEITQDDRLSGTEGFSSVA